MRILTALPKILFGKKFTIFLYKFYEYCGNPRGGLLVAVRVVEAGLRIEASARRRLLLLEEVGFEPVNRKTVLPEAPESSL